MVLYPERKNRNPFKITLFFYPSVCHSQFSPKLLVLLSSTNEFLIHWVVHIFCKSVIQRLPCNVKLLGCAYWNEVLPSLTLCWNREIFISQLSIFFKIPQKALIKNIYFKFWMPFKEALLGGTGPSYAVQSV